ncbi:hypothetical protein IWW34DRAFT_793848 [Fusarium oxysporum f. sp. albedinis]|nr:hypothetical protein IWW34DRAFT_793848 [Fusarium oxysporum f. sp. albedinis]
MSCTPIYLLPQQIRTAALEELQSLEALRPHQWVDASTIFLNKDGSFSVKLINEKSSRVYMLKASLFMVDLFCSPRLKVTKEQQRPFAVETEDWKRVHAQRNSGQQRLHHARRRLLVSLLAHAWLWGRPKVLDNQGNMVAFEERRVLSPTEILRFLQKIQVQKRYCTYKEVRDFLEKVQEVSLYEDTSKWNIAGVIACVWWDKSHNRDGGPWCSCRLEKELPPPYQEVCPPESHKLGMVHRLRAWIHRGHTGNSKDSNRAVGRDRLK